MTTPRNKIRYGRGLLTVNALVLAALAIGFLNNAIIAGIFGLTRSVDAFFAATVLPTMFMALCVDYLGKNFLPVLATANQESSACASTLTSSVVTIVAGLAIAVTIVLVIFRRPLFTVLLPGFDSAEIEVVAHYFTIMAPAIVFMAINTFHEYVWQYAEKFVYVSIARLALPAANLLGIVLLAPSLGEQCLPVGFLIGHATVFLMLLPKIPYRYRPTFAMRPNLERRVFSNSAVVMSTGLIARTRSIIMNYIASTLGSGAIAALALAVKLTEPLERSAFAGARMIMFSHTARLFVERNEAALGQLYRTGLRMSFLLTAPFLWWVCLNSQEIVKVLFLRGEFTPEMSVVVAATLVGLVPSVLFFGVNQMLSNAFYAMDHVKVPAIVMPVGTLIYVGAAVPLAALYATQGLAMATTVTQLVVFVGLFACFARFLRTLNPLRTSGYLIVYAALSGAFMIMTMALLEAFGVRQMAAAVLSLPIGVGLYFGALAALGDDTYKRLMEFVRSCIVRNPSTDSAGVAPP